MLSACALWLTLACGRTTPRDLFGTVYSLGNDEAETSDDHPTDAAAAQRDSAPSDTGEEAGTPPACLKNADCEDDSVCIRGQCAFFGECLLDRHCGPNRTCSSNQCTGDPLVFGGSIACQINADCPEHFYCVGGRCELGVECTKHAHCPSEEACLGGVCFSAIN